MNSFVLQTSLRPEQLDELLGDALPRSRVFGSLYGDGRMGVGCSGRVWKGCFSIRLGTSYLLLGTPFDLLHVSGRILEQTDGTGVLVGFVHLHPLVYPALLLAGLICLYGGLQGYPLQSAWALFAITLGVFTARFLALRLWGPLLVDRILGFFDSVFTYRLCPYTKTVPAWFFVLKPVVQGAARDIRKRGSNGTVYPDWTDG